LAVGDFEVVHVVVETSEHDGDVLVEGLAAGDALEVFGLDVAAQRRVSASDVWDAFGFDVDFVFGGFEFEDAGDVDGGAVGRAEDFLLLWVSTAVVPATSRGKCPHIPLTQ
jgi:hypothetical protein